MLEFTGVRAELGDEEGEPVLRAYLTPGSVSAAELELSYESDDNGIKIIFERQGSGLWGSISLDGYSFPPGMAAKYSSKKKRYTFNLSKHGAEGADAGADTAPVQDIEQQAAPQAADKQRMASPEANCQDQGQGHEGDEQQETDAGDQDAQADVLPGDSAAKKKKKKKNKKKKQAAAGADAGEEGAGTSAAAEHEGGAAVVAGPQGDDVDEDEEERFEDALTEMTGADDSASQDQQLKSQPSSRGPSPSGPDAKLFDPEAWESYLSGPRVAEVAVALQEDAAQAAAAAACPSGGPVVHYSLAKHEVKKEDKWLQAPRNNWKPEGWPAAANFGAFGVFDGHGGAQSSSYAARALLQQQLKECLEVCSGSDPEIQPAGEPGDHGTAVDASEEDRAVWAAQEALIERLPKAMYGAFMRADAECKRRFQKSGTTATLAVACGWELLVASVGDSCAYLDTGREIMLVSANHRIDDNQEEQARITAAGGEIARSSVEGVEAGPLRVWPGGLAMSRSIGDLQAGDLVPGSPEVRQVTLPTSGARLVIASDGVWDQGNSAKSVVGGVRLLHAGAAAQKIAANALRKKGLRDDITVLVVDFLPAGSAPELKWNLGSGGQGGAGASASIDARLQHYRPLETSSTSWRAHLAARRLAALERTRALARTARDQRDAAEEAEAAEEAAPADEVEVEAAPAAYDESAFKCVVDPLALLSVMQEEEDERDGQQAAGDEEWTEVGSKPKVNFEAEMRAAAARGRATRGAGRFGARGGGRFGARGGGRFGAPAPQEQAVAEGEAPAANGHVGGRDGGRGGRFGGRARGYGGRFGGRGRGGAPHEHAGLQHERQEQQQANSGQQQQGEGGHHFGAGPVDASQPAADSSAEQQQHHQHHHAGGYGRHGIRGAYGGRGGRGRYGGSGRGYTGPHPPHAEHHESKDATHEAGAALDAPAGRDALFHAGRGRGRGRGGFSRGRGRKFPAGDDLAGGDHALAAAAAHDQGPAAPAPQARASGDDGAAGDEGARAARGRGYGRGRRGSFRGRGGGDRVGGGDRPAGGPHSEDVGGTAPQGPGGDARVAHGPRPPMQCYRCSQVGHISRNCPNAGQ